jgi:hypothetical protein
MSDGWYSRCATADRQTVVARKLLQGLLAKLMKRSGEDLARRSQACGTPFFKTKSGDLQ